MDKIFYGLPRSRDKKGKVVKRTLKPHTNCIHAQTGMARENMEVYIVQIQGAKIMKTIVGSKQFNAFRGSIEGVSPCITQACGAGGGMTPMITDATIEQTKTEKFMQEMRNSDDNKQGRKLMEKSTLCIPQATAQGYTEVPQATAQGYTEVPQGGAFDASYLNSKTRRGRVQENGNVTPALTSQGEQPCINEGKKHKTFRIRKLTPRECFRLMGVDDKDIDTIQQSGVSNSQQYKMAGNSIVVDVLYHIFRKAFVQKKNESPQLTFDL